MSEILTIIGVEASKDHSGSDFELSMVSEHEIIDASIKYDEIPFLN